MFPFSTSRTDSDLPPSEVAYGERFPLEEDPSPKSFTVLAFFGSIGVVGEGGPDIIEEGAGVRVTD